ncbi:hypothetical protein pah_c170o005 [Parachlamydia acanthamoebae str. Hall's coccus]|nr:hypothetical protein pah_c170o005 [Parachlamydia acanthamoebae str. Hall's coccus]
MDIPFKIQVAKILSRYLICALFVVVKQKGAFQAKDGKS